MRSRVIWVISTMLVLALVGGVFGCSTPPASPATGTSTPATAETITLKYADYLPNSGQMAATTNWWADEIVKRTNGQVKFKFYWAESLVKAADMLDATGKGITDIGYQVSAYIPAKLPLTTLAAIPYQNPNGAVRAAAFKDLVENYAPLKEEYSSKNVKPLHINVSQSMVIGGKKPIKTLEDLQGVKVRALGDANGVMNMLGATAVQISIGDVYEALQRGTVEAYTGVPLAIASLYKFYEVAKYVTQPSIGPYSIGARIINLDVWNKLPKDVQDVITQVTKEEQDRYFSEVITPIDVAAVKAYQDNGVEMYMLPHSEVVSWRAKVMPELIDSRAAQAQKDYGVPGPEFVQKYTEACEKWDKIVGSQYVDPFPK